MWAGALFGGLRGAASGLLNPFVCFTARTQVVTGIETESADTPSSPLQESETQFASSDSAVVATAPAIRSYITQSIESLRPGDLILARDQHDPNAGLVLRRIEELFTRTTYRLLHLTLQDSHGTLQTLHTTAEHPLYALGHGWLAAGKLKPGDTLAQTNGQTSHVLAIESTLHPEGLTVYNLRVAHAHTYFVRAESSDAEPVWVHNECGGRRGNEKTRQHLEDVRDEFLANNPDFRHVAGGRSATTGSEVAEEYIRNITGGRKGGSYADLTFENTLSGDRVRVNTVDTLANGNMTAREATNFARIYQSTNQPIIVFPKPRL